MLLLNTLCMTQDTIRYQASHALSMVILHKITLHKVVNYSKNIHILKFTKLYGFIYEEPFLSFHLDFYPNMYLCFFIYWKCIWPPMLVLVLMTCTIKELMRLSSDEQVQKSLKCKRAMNDVIFANKMVFRATLKIFYKFLFRIWV